MFKPKKRDIDKAMAVIDWACDSATARVGNQNLGFVKAWTAISMFEKSAQATQTMIEQEWEIVK